jgi:hypothetical protein
MLLTVVSALSALAVAGAVNTHATIYVHAQWHGQGTSCNEQEYDPTSSSERVYQFERIVNKSSAFCPSISCITQIKVACPDLTAMQNIRLSDTANWTPRSLDGNADFSGYTATTRENSRAGDDQPAAIYTKLGVCLPALDSGDFIKYSCNRRQETLGSSYKNLRCHGKSIVAHTRVEAIPGTVVTCSKKKIHMGPGIITGIVTGCILTTALLLGLMCKKKPFRQTVTGTSGVISDALLHDIQGSSLRLN